MVRKYALLFNEHEADLQRASNLRFEYWLLLHFEETPMRLDTGDLDLYNRELSGLLGRTYSKSEGPKSALTVETAMDAIARSRRRLPSGNAIECHGMLNSTCMHTIAESILSER